MTRLPNDDLRVPTTELDAVRLGPDDDAAEVSAAQARDVITRLITVGHWRDGDPVIFDAGYDVTRLAFLLADLPAVSLCRQYPGSRASPVAARSGNWRDPA